MKVGNDHKKVTPKTAGTSRKKDDKKFTSYDTSREETSTPQKVKENGEASSEYVRMKKSKR